MKKSLISSAIAASLLLLGSISPAIVSADTTTNGDINVSDKGVVDTKNLATLYALNNGSLKRGKNRALGAYTSWVYNKSVTGADGITYYRVATNEWVGSNNLSKISSKSTARATTTIYIGNWAAAVVNASGSRIGRVLPAHSAWSAFTDTVTINGANYYQIGQGQYVSVYDTSNAPVANNNNNSSNNNNSTNNNKGTSVLIDTTRSNKIIGNSDSKIFHVPGQRGFKINVNNIVYFNTVQDAINAGYQKSKV